MEILRVAGYTPHRLHAIVRLVPKLQNPKRGDILNLVQPPNLVGKKVGGRVDQNTSSELLNIALHLELLQLDADGETYRLHDSLQEQRDLIDDIQHFRLILQQRVSNPGSDHNERFRRVTAWYAVQDERVFSHKTKVALAKQFSDELGDRDVLEEGREFNDTQYNGWLQWAVFLGWGWRMKIDRVDFLIPNCSDRLKPLLPELLPKLNEEMPMSDFMQRIAENCVELDGGAEFERCRTASRPTDPRSKMMSLMMSSGLRTLQDQKLIELILLDDSLEWRLYPAETRTQRVSHIKRIKGVSR